MLRLSSITSHWTDDSPCIVVSAPYLDSFGFEVGGRIVVEITHGLITIKPLDSEEDL